MQVPFIANI